MIPTPSQLRQLSRTRLHPLLFNVALGLTFVLIGLAAGGVALGQETTLEGVWRPTAYIQKDGSNLPVSGRIFFLGDQWTVLFFVLDDHSRPSRGSAEGGHFTLEGEQLTFWHERNVSGPASGSVRLVLRDFDQAEAERCSISLQKESLRIHFPSGNRMDFERIVGR